MSQKGFIEIAVGPMFSGKSSWLIKKMEDLKDNHIPYLAIRYGDDNRYSENAISSHNNTHFSAYSAKTADDIRNLLKNHPTIVAIGIDEIQFFPKEVASLLRELKRKDLSIYVAGLDTDFLGTKWETTTQVVDDADIINTFKAVCSICQKRIATRTQRLIDGLPASKESPRILIDGADSYTARCADHHQIAA